MVVTEDGGFRAVIFGFSVRSISEPDIWWHLRNGEQTALHHAIPRIDTYSFGATRLTVAGPRMAVRGAVFARV